MTKRSLQIIVSGVLGIGALLSIATGVKADPQCVADTCPSNFGTINYDGCTQIEDLPPNTQRRFHVGTEQDEDSCLDCDGDCIKHTVTYHVVYATCQVWIKDANGEWVYSSTVGSGYEKTKTTTGGICS